MCSQDNCFGGAKCIDRVCQCSKEYSSTSMGCIPDDLMMRFGTDFFVVSRFFCS
jgi:hypothetical protein